jgi:hypothetical protein
MALEKCLWKDDRYMDFPREQFIIGMEIEGVFLYCVLGLRICHGSVAYKSYIHLKLGLLLKVSSAEMTC